MTRSCLKLIMGLGFRVGDPRDISNLECIMIIIGYPQGLHRRGFGTKAHARAQFLWSICKVSTGLTWGVYEMYADNCPGEHEQLASFFAMTRGIW